MHADTGVSMKDDRERVTHVPTAGRAGLSLAALIIYLLIYYFFLSHNLDLGEGHTKSRIPSSSVYVPRVKCFSRGMKTCGGPGVAAL